MSEPINKPKDRLAVYMSFVVLNLTLIPKPFNLVISIILLFLVVKNIGELKRYDKQKANG